MPDDPADPRSDRDLLQAAAARAGTIAMEHFRRAPERWDKNDGSGPVTEADLAINAMLDRTLRAARPDYGWLSEESEDDLARLSTRRQFIIDPIDGTRAFIAGEQGFSVALAVVEAGKVIAAVVRLPARQETFAAALGAGARKNGAPIRVSGRAGLPGASVLAAKVQMRDANWPGGQPPVERHFRSSLAWRFCLVAEGAFDSMVTFRDSYEWDIAAGALIAAEAGAMVTDGSGAALRFNSRRGMQPGVVAAPPALHAGLMGYRRAG